MDNIFKNVSYIAILAVWLAIYVAYTAVTVTPELLCLSPAEKKNHVMIITSYKDNVGGPLHSQ